MSLAGGVYQRSKICVGRLRRNLAYDRALRAAAPIVFGNAMPKSGSHLLYQILQGICRIGPFAETGSGPIRRITERERRTRSVQEMLRDLQALKPGDVAWGYLEAAPEIMEFLCRKGIVNYFMIRDPRDMLVSHVFYASEMHAGHGMHKLYTSLNSFDECLKIAIRGWPADGLNLPSAAKRYEAVMAWLDRPAVMVIRFESLIDGRQRVIDGVLSHLESSGYQPQLSRALAAQRIAAAIQPGRSPTYRRGAAGSWREYFKKEHKTLFKEICGDLLMRLGYEEHNDW
jgi:sulfotransferase 6B1